MAMSLKELFFLSRSKKVGYQIPVYFYLNLLQIGEKQTKVEVA